MAYFFCLSGCQFRGRDGQLRQVERLEKATVVMAVFLGEQERLGELLAVEIGDVGQREIAVQLFAGIDEPASVLAPAVKTLGLRGVE